jgi:hypothetical protein
MVSAVIDRIVDETTAVLHFEGDQTQLHVPIHQLPEGSTEGQWLLVCLENGDFVYAEFDASKTQEAKERISKKRALLLERMARRGRHQ